jgi:hypothetical protein
LYYKSPFVSHIKTVSQAYEQLLAKRDLKYFSVKERVREKDPSKSLKILIVVKNIFASHIRHQTLVIGDHHGFFYRCVLS